MVPSFVWIASECLDSDPDARQQAAIGMSREPKTDRITPVVARKFCPASSTAVRAPRRRAVPLATSWAALLAARTPSRASLRTGRRSNSTVRMNSCSRQAVRRSSSNAGIKRAVHSRLTTARTTRAATPMIFMMDSVPMDNSKPTTDN
jgi:hypothetical protein